MVAPACWNGLTTNFGEIGLAHAGFDVGDADGLAAQIRAQTPRELLHKGFGPAVGIAAGGDVLRLTTKQLLGRFVDDLLFVLNFRRRLSCT